MKATFITSVFAVFVSIMNVSAQGTMTLSNVSETEKGTAKEYITVDEATHAPISKVYYFYDAAGNLQERTTSVWNNEKGWESRYNYTYQYGDDNSLLYVAYTKWDNQTNNWSEKSDILVHAYNYENETLSIVPFSIDNSEKDYSLYAQL